MKGNNQQSNIAIVVEGSSHRMGQDILKQFINVYDKPSKNVYSKQGFLKNWR